MTTQSWSTRVRHDDDATFQEWATELFNKLVAVGLVQTADSGQLATPVVASIPGSSTAAGYWVFEFDDAQQSTAPIFLKVEVGTHSGSTSPRIRFTVGTGSNGSGTLTGTALTTTRVACGNSPQTSNTGWQSLMCHTEGFFGFCWKMQSSSDALFMVCRTSDSSGIPTATGAMVVWGSSNSGTLTATQALRFAATAVAYAARTAVDQTALGMNPQCRDSSAVGGDTQAYLGYTVTPQVSPLIGMCGVLDSEVSDASTFTATLVGATPHTYVACTYFGGPFGPVAVGTTGGLKFAMLWE